MIEPEHERVSDYASSLREWGQGGRRSNWEVVVVTGQEVKEVAEVIRYQI